MQRLFYKFLIEDKRMEINIYGILKNMGNIFELFL